MRALEEGNPMLGTRGVRLGLLHPEIYEMQVRAIFRAARAVRRATGRAPKLEIKLLRACLVAGEIARHAQFFSFGTNDLTQTALGFSRDDIEGRILPHYRDCQIVERSPFRVPVARVAAAQAAIAADLS